MLEYLSRIILGAPLECTYKDVGWMSNIQRYETSQTLLECTRCVSGKHVLSHMRMFSDMSRHRRDVLSQDIRMQ